MNKKDYKRIVSTYKFSHVPPHVCVEMIIHGYFNNPAINDVPYETRAAQCARRISLFIEKEVRPGQEIIDQTVTFKT